MVKTGIVALWTTLEISGVVFYLLFIYFFFFFFCHLGKKIFPFTLTGGTKGESNFFSFIIIQTYDFFFFFFFFVFSSAVFLKKYNVRISLFVNPHKLSPKC